MNNEEKIIALLEKQGAALEKQGELLAKHDVMLEHINETLERHDAMFERINDTLDKHTAILEQHSQILAEHSKTLASHSEMLESHGEMLESHGEMLENLTTRVTKIELTQENVILPGLQALAEGQETLRQTLCSRERAERLETDVDLLKTAVRGLFRDVQELKKAQ